MTACAINGCPTPVHAKGLCHLHYRQQLRANKPKNHCGCGCGELTLYTYVHGHHTRLFSNEEQARRAQFNDGSALRNTGAGKSYRKLFQRHEHRVVAEQKIGRPLQSSEIAHHKDRDIRNNHPDNIEVLTRVEHMKEHRPELLAGKRSRRAT